MPLILIKGIAVAKGLRMKRRNGRRAPLCCILI